MGSVVNIVLPDGSKKVFEASPTGAEVALSIGPGLAKSALAVIVNGVEWDLTRRIERDSSVSIITRDSDEALPLLRHDCAHVLAEAVQEIWPDVQVTIGPPVENGFYYDVLFEDAISSDDLQSIEDEMRQIIKTRSKIRKSFNNKQDAVSKFLSLSESYKAQIIQESNQEK